MGPLTYTTKPKLYPKNYKGDPGSPVELRVEGVMLQWKWLTEPADKWRNLAEVGGGSGPIPEDSVLVRNELGQITQVVKETKTIDITYTDGVISRVEDGTYRKDIIRVDGVITEIQVTTI